MEVSDRHLPAIGVSAPATSILRGAASKEPGPKAAPRTMFAAVALTLPGLSLMYSRVAFVAARMAGAAATAASAAALMSIFESAHQVECVWLYL